jgi:hypothetical protein
VRSSFLALISLLFLLPSCEGGKEDDVPLARFDAPFPKRNIDLTQVLGDEVSFLRGFDTLSLEIAHSGKFNLIRYAASKDTFFYGSVSRYRGAYYLSRHAGNSSYEISKVKIFGDKVCGLESGRHQSAVLGEKARNGQLSAFVVHVDPDSLCFTLHAGKKQIRRLLDSISMPFRYDTLILLGKAASSTVYISSTKTELTPEDVEEDYELIRNVYPNPAVDEINVELHEKQGCDYFITSIEGGLDRSAALIRGQLNDKVTRIDISSLKSGTYVLTVNIPVKTYENVTFIKVR